MKSHTTKSYMKQTITLTLLLLAGAAQADSFTLQSSDIKAGGPLTQAQVFKGFGCDGDNRSPQLSWSHAPAGTKSFAITAYDPDAPTGSGWWHWVAFNIPANVTTLPSNAGNPATGLAPAGIVQSRTDFGTVGFGGACPPKGHGKHRYQFTVHALSVEKLDLGDQVPAAMVGYNLNAHSLGKATLEATYER
ncbi:MAG TPA: YbhB/YbcL family Raf kinase inhibitor-like protein [Dongiaceae bacterium]|nr:YbhB/YbcL family Raf kinase inhibitor-like protein [Dongiaceae bacterium]